MKRSSIKVGTCLLCAVFFTLAMSLSGSTVAKAGPKRTLTIYFIDVEGGQSTLLVTPDRHSLLIDTGWAGKGSGYAPIDPHQARDASRIVAAARDAGIHKIDYLLITHFHPDHDGGVLELSKLLPIHTFIDHDTVSADAAHDADTQNAFDEYVKVRGAAPHMVPQPGDRLPLKDLDAFVVSSAGKPIVEPLASARAATVLCANATLPARDPYENPRSTGVLIQFGKFRFLDLGDLSGQPLHDLACPRNLIGPVDVYLVAHHGGPDAADAATFSAFMPRVAIMNNGLKKGGSLETYTALHQVPGLEDVWQLHRSEVAGDQNFPDAQIENVDESTSSWIKLIANSNGQFQVVNGRTGQTKTYTAR